jgi:RimJ/RimL family protein N-acetyltransferase
MKNPSRGETDLATVHVLDTERLTLRTLSNDAADFIVELLNEPSFIEHIGDKGVRTRDEAFEYIRTGPASSYATCGFGLYLVELKATGESLGMCGLLKRPALDDPDLGFAFLPRYWSKGYAFEAASGVLAYARSTLGITRVLAITSQGNAASIALLGRLGFRFEGTKQLAAAGEPELNVFAWTSSRT